MRAYHVIPAGRRLTGDATAFSSTLLPFQALQLAADLDREADINLVSGGSASRSERLASKAADLRATCRLPEQLPAADERRWNLGVEHLGALGTRALGYLLMQVVVERRDIGGTLDLLDDWRRLSPATVRAQGGDRFPRRRLVEVA